MKRVLTISEFLGLVGGKGTLAGPIVGGMIFGLLPEALRSLKVGPELQWVAYGVLMIVIVSILPSGIVPAITHWWNDRSRREVKAEDAGAGQGAQ